MNLQDSVIYSVELMTFVTGLAVSIPGIVWTIYALLRLTCSWKVSVVYTLPTDILSGTHAHIPCDCCTFYIEVIITVKKKISIELAKYKST